MDVKILMPKWPNFVHLDLGDGQRKSDRMISVARLSDEEIKDLCADFLMHCTEKRNDPLIGRLDGDGGILSINSEDVIND